MRQEIEWYEDTAEETCSDYSSFFIREYMCKGHTPQSQE